MKAWRTLALVSALGFATCANADCIYPKSPVNPPDGNTASKEEMTAAARDTKRYNDEMNTYLDCLTMEQKQVASAPKPSGKMSADDKKKFEDDKKAQDAMYVQKHNAAVDEMHAIADKFNEQLKIYKAKNAKT